MKAIEQPPAEGVRSVTFGGPTVNQPEYQPLPALVYPDGCILTEWVPTEEERLAIAQGENIRLWTWTNGIQFPLSMGVTSEDRG